MFFLSWLTALGSGTESVCFITLTDSPVRDTRFTWGSGHGGNAGLSSVPTPTSKNGLVHTQGCRFDGDDSDVSWHFVTN